jgi:DNA-directed RNA polymerase specialized sigma24 family protein
LAWLVRCQAEESPSDAPDLDGSDVALERVGGKAGFRFFCLTAVFAIAASSAVFNDRARFSMRGTARAARIAILYDREAQTVQRLVARRASAPAVVIEDACQAAWERLCAHADVDVDTPAAVGWLVVTATREAWRGAGGREIPVGGWQSETVDERELPEPVADGPGPLDSAIEHEHSDALRDRLGTLTDRERQFLDCTVRA